MNLAVTATHLRSSNGDDGGDGDGRGQSSIVIFWSGPGDLGSIFLTDYFAPEAVDQVHRDR